MRNEFAKWEIKTSMFSGRKSRVGNCWTQRAIEGRLALDLLREQHAQGRAQTTKILHKARAA